MGTHIPDGGTPVLAEGGTPVPDRWGVSDQDWGNPQKGPGTSHWGTPSDGTSGIIMGWRWGNPLPGGEQTDRLKALPPPIFWMRSVNTLKRNRNRQMTQHQSCTVRQLLWNMWIPPFVLPTLEILYILSFVQPPLTCEKLYFVCL